MSGQYNYKSPKDLKVLGQILSKVPIGFEEILRNNLSLQKHQFTSSCLLTG